MKHFDIHPGDLDDPRVIALLEEHLASMEPTAPAESRHALDLNGLRDPHIRFWCVWDQQSLAGFGALKHLDSTHAEIKSMRTASNYLRQGVADKLLHHLIELARAEGIERLSLETGAMNYFIPARSFYAKYGFVECKPFASYRDDPLSVFMTRWIA